MNLFQTLTRCALFTAMLALGPASYGEALVADGAADARKDFAEGMLVLLGGRDMPGAVFDLPDGEVLEVVTDACALGPDPEGYMADYNAMMKQLIGEAYGIDVDALLLSAPH